MAEGFRAAQAFVEVSADVDDSQVLGAAARAASQFDGGMKRGTRGTGGAVAGQLKDGVMKAVPQIGSTAATGLIGSLSRGVAAGGSIVGPALIALSPAIVVAASAVGAMASAALVSGLGLAAMTGGIVLALKAPAVADAAANTGKTITKALSKAAAPFQSELIEVFRVGSGAFARWEPQLKRIFSVSATFVQPLTRGVISLVDRMLPGLTKAVEAIGPSIGAIGTGLSWVGREIGYLFKDLSDNGPEMVAGITMAFSLLVAGIRVASVTLNVLTEMFGFFMEQAFRMGPILQGIGANLQTIPGPLGDIGTKLVAQGTAINEGKAHWDALGKKMTEASTAGEVGMNKLTVRQIVLTQSMREGVKAAGDLASYFKVLNGVALSLDEAESRYQAALDAVTESIKTNGKTTDDHTAKGRANLQVLREIKAASEAKAQAAFDDAMATGNVVGAEKAAKAAYEAGRTQLIKARIAMGDSRAEAVAYANKIMKIPKSWSTKATIDTSTATKKLDTFIKKVTNADGKVVNVTVQVTSKGDHHIPGVGTQVKADGGWIQGGSGIRDDVPVLAMGGEFMLRRRAASALERQFGKGFLDRLNWWDRPGGPRRPNVVAPTEDPVVSAIGGIDRGDRGDATVKPGGGGSPSYHFAPGAFTLDLSRMKDVGELIDMVRSLTQTARTMGAVG